jgi:hypothetical protein
MDVHRIAGAMSDAELVAAADLAVQRGVATICSRALVRAWRRFGTRVPAAAWARLAPRREEATAEYLQPRRRWRDEVWSSLRALPAWGERMALLHEILVPDRAYMRSAYGLKVGKREAVLLPALYLYRGANGVLKVLLGRK